VVVVVVTVSVMPLVLVAVVVNPDAWPENLDCDVSALAQGVHDFIQVVAIQEHALGAALPVDCNVGAVIA
jgi:hypothetical protein